MVLKLALKVCVLVCVLSGLHRCLGISSKKGITLWWEHLDCADFQMFANNITWWYDWRNDIDYYKTKFATCEGVNNTGGILDKHVPMTWGRRRVTVDTTFPPSADYVLGFNEPNHKSQSNITPRDAADLWRILEDVSGDRKLVSPSAAKCGDVNKCNGTDTAWFDEFFQYCNGCRVDYLATHLYNCNAAGVMADILKLYNRYQRPIWLTEFACLKTNDTQKQLDFMKAILPQLEAAPHVFRYSWFTARRHVDKYITRSANLLKEFSPEWSEIGQYSWFTARRHVDKYITRSANLLKEFTPEWSEIGQYYISYQPYSWFTARRHVDKYITRSANLLKEFSPEWSEIGQYYISYQP